MNCECNNNVIKVTFSKSKTLTFDFDSVLDGFSAQFCVRKDFKSEPVLNKIKNDLSGNSFNLELTVSDNSVYGFKENEDPAEYIWGLDLFNEDTRISVFPATGDNAPLFYVFKNVVVNDNEM